MKISTESLGERGEGEARGELLLVSPPTSRNCFGLERLRGTGLSSDILGAFTGGGLELGEEVL